MELMEAGHGTLSALMDPYSEAQVEFALQTVTFITCSAQVVAAHAPLRSRRRWLWLGANPEGKFGHRSR